MGKVMCQAYEGERASIVASEQYATKKGYEAAKNGEPKVNPYGEWDMYRYKAWNHGYGCFEEGIVPWFMEKEKDERLKKTDPTLDDWFTFRDSCRAALLAKEEAEGRVCRAREAINNDGLTDEEALVEIQIAFDGTAPCRHAERVKTLEAAVEWIGFLFEIVGDKKKEVEASHEQWCKRMLIWRKELTRRAEERGKG